MYIKQLSPKTAIAVILITISIVVVTGYFVFFKPRPPTEQEPVVAPIIGKLLDHTGDGDTDTARCSVRAVSYVRSEASTKYLLVDCKVTVHPFKGIADKVITSRPDLGETTYRERITLLSKGKEIGRVTIPTYYEHDGYHLRVREVYHDVSTTPAN